MMQSSERVRLVTAYRDEAAGRLGLLFKCVACVAVLALVGAIAFSAADDAASVRAGNPDAQVPLTGAPSDGAQDPTAASGTGTQTLYAVMQP